MSRRPYNYQALRDEHARATEAALNQHIEQTAASDPQKGPDASADLANDPQPTRPEGRPYQGWTSSGDMVAQQASAMEKLKAEASAREQAAGQNVPGNAERSAAAALDQHIDGPQQDVPEQDAAAAALDRQMEGPQQGASEPEVAAALDRQVESQEPSGVKAEFQDAAREALDHHVEAPDPPQGPSAGSETEIDRSPDLDV